jgi:putative aminopeptidase FrvX
LGEGVAIKIMDSFSISNHKILRELRDLATKKKIKHQMEILPRGGTDAGVIRQVSGHTAVCTISVPLRYVHSTVETVHKADLEASVNLLTAYLETTTGIGYDLGEKL